MRITVSIPTEIEADAIEIDVPLRYDEDREALAGTPGVTGSVRVATVSPADRRRYVHLATHDARSKLHSATADRRGWVLAEAEVVRCEDAEDAAQAALDKLKTRAHASNYGAIAKLRKLADERYNALTAEWHRRHPAKADQPAGEP